MSVLKKIPLIETIIGSLEDDEISELIDVCNSNPAHERLSLVNSAYIPTTADKGIYWVDFELELGNEKSGILIWNDDYCVLLGAHRFEDLAIFELDIPHRTFTKVNEYLTIEELRRILTGGAGGSGRGVSAEDVYNVSEGSDDITVDYNEGGTKVQYKLDQDIKDYIVPVEVPLAKIQHDIGASDSKIIVLAGVLDASNHYEITFEVESTNVHFGDSFVVFPENESPCFTEGLVDVDGENKTYIATMDTTGQITITLIDVILDPSSEDTKIYYRRHI